MQGSPQWFPVFSLVYRQRESGTALWSLLLFRASWWPVERGGGAVDEQNPVRLGVRAKCTRRVGEEKACLPSLRHVSLVVSLVGGLPLGWSLMKQISEMILTCLYCFIWWWIQMCTLYLGWPTDSIPFGGRNTQEGKLIHWLKAQGYLDTSLTWRRTPGVMLWDWLPMVLSVGCSGYMF